MYVYVPEYMCGQVYEGQKMASDALELELVVWHQIWCWEPNASPMQEQMLLTSASSQLYPR